MRPPRRVAVARALLGLAGLLAGCGADPAPPEVTVHPAGVAVRAEEGITRVSVEDPAGLPLLTRRAPAPVDLMELQVPWGAAGAHTVRVRTADGEEHAIQVPVAAAGRFTLEVEAPVGQGAEAVGEGAAVPLVLLGGEAGEAAVTVTAHEAGEVAVRIGHAPEARRSLRPGERLVARAAVAAEGGPVPVAVQVPGRTTRFTIVPRPLSPEAARERLSLVAVDFPAEASGWPDPARPAGRVTLPSPWWGEVLRRTGLGFRPRDHWSPYAHVGVELENTGEEPLTVVLRARVTDPDGAPAPAFAPRLREGVDAGGAVTALLRVPPGQRARGALPLFVDEARLPPDATAEGRWERVVEVLPLGAHRPLVVDRAPLYVTRGSTAASAGIGVAVLAAILGSLLLLRRGPRWLSTARTSELMTIALFGSLTFLVGAVGRLLGMGVGAVLGPFSVFFTGLVDDLFRYALLATLLALLPRPGTAALAVLTGWLLSGIALGTFGPTDLLFVGGRVLWLEGALWLFGVTRATGWLDEAPWRRWLRLAGGFGVASALTSATGIVLHMVLYRLFYADWYVAAVVLLPGFAYVVLACGVAVPFAASLRRVQR